MTKKIKYLEPKKKGSKNKYQAEKFVDLFEHVKIQTNELCTRSCSFCYYGHQVNKHRPAELPDKVVYRLIDELSLLRFNGD